MFKLKSRTRAALVGVVATSAALVAPMAAEASRTPYATNMYSGPSYYTHWIGGTLAGSYVVMNCWTDSNVWSYGSNRWFHVGGVGFNPRSGRIVPMSGFVPANRVTQQIAVRHC